MTIKHQGEMYERGGEKQPINTTKTKQCQRERERERERELELELELENFILQVV